ncbi:hypothetical protein [Flavobacterium davisii]|uniref:hypothetical protein n=1 Tax=Flavobacterium davisii TaxID=2906077 RepID=UPI0035CFAC14
MKKIIFIAILNFTLLNYSQNNLRELKGIKTNSIGTFQFSEASYYDYLINSSNVTDSLYVKVDYLNSPEGLLTQKFDNLLSINKDSIVNKISVFSKISLEYNQEIYCFIKFRSIQHKSISKNQIFISKKESNVWKEYIETSKIIEHLKVIFLLKEKAFSQFEIKDNNPKYPEINKLKPLVRDADGTLNLYKLSKIIEENKSTLSKYLDE